jgi:hypothetical protein
MHAGFGHRHATSRRAREATERVNATQARIAEIRAEGAAVKEALNGLEDRARHLVDVSNAAFTSSLDQLDHLELDAIDRVVSSLDTWTA